MAFKHGQRVHHCKLVCKCVADVCDGLLQACLKHTMIVEPAQGEQEHSVWLSADVVLELHTEQVPQVGQVCNVVEGFR